MYLNKTLGCWVHVVVSASAAQSALRGYLAVICLGLTFFPAAK